MSLRRPDRAEDAARAPLHVLGASGHAKVVIAAVRAAGLEVEAVYDDDPARLGGHTLGAPVAGPIGAVRPGAPAVAALGDNAVRRRVVAQLAPLRLRWQRVVHPHAWVSPDATVEPGAVVCAGAVVQPGATVGAHAIVNTGATVDHDCVVGPFAHVAVGAHLAGAVTVGEGVLVGAGAVVVQCVSIGPWSTLGAGAVCLHDLAERVVAVGVPARAHPARPTGAPRDEGST
ncbi:MAG: NeuD/PglB/VioB family sugar acetyltransferase [Myxococcales bacterium]|nr:NeuD/PglB/VioB family sugar acetyltransferase [Myxococcales bacterium]